MKTNSDVSSAFVSFQINTNTFTSKVYRHFLEFGKKNKLWSTHHQLQMLSHQLEIRVIRNIKYNKDWYTKRLHFNSIEKLPQFSLAF